MKNHIKRITALFLTVVQVMLIFSACSDSKNETNSESGSNTDSNNEETDLTEIYTGLEDYNLDGYEFRILVNSVSAEHCHHNDSLSVEEYNGEGVNDAVHQRELALYDKYNFVVEPIVASGGHDSGWSEQFKKSVQANDSDFDIGICTTGPCSSVVLNGCTIPWNELDNVDLSQPWWNQSAQESLSVKGVTYYTTGDLTYETIAFTYCMFFNKELTEDWGITADSLYELVD